MADTDDERALFAQRDKDLAELYPTNEAWERSYPPTLPPQDAELRAQYDDWHELNPSSRTEQALKHSQASSEIAAQRQRDLNLHDRLMGSGAAEASRDLLHGNQSGKEPGAYTAHEARDRAAHTPPTQERSREQ